MNCGSTDPFPRRRVIKLVLAVLAAVVAAALFFYFYERAKELRLAEERAKAVGDRIFQTRPVVTPPAEQGPGGQ